MTVGPLEEPLEPQRVEYWRDTAVVRVPRVVRSEFRGRDWRTNDVIFARRARVFTIIIYYRRWSSSTIKKKGKTTTRQRNGKYAIRSRYSDNSF